MNIYFACALTGGREFESVYQIIVAELLADGHAIPTAHLAQFNAMSDEKMIQPRSVYDRDVNWIQNCNVLIAEVSVPSHGVGYEIGYALSAGKKVLCLYQEDRKVSKMITGNPNPALLVQTYSDPEEAVCLARKFIEKLE